MSEMKKTQEHAWLQKLVGEWRGEGEAAMGPGAPVEKFAMDETVRAIGDVWVQCESLTKPPAGGSATTIMTLGFDPDKQRFRGTFIGSMMTYLWIYDGALDASGKILVLDAEGPSMTGDGKMARYRDSIELISDDHRTLSSQMQLPDGTWSKFMTMHYRRKQ